LTRSFGITTESNGTPQDQLAGCYGRFAENTANQIYQEGLRLLQIIPGINPPAGAHLAGVTPATRAAGKRLAALE